MRTSLHQTRIIGGKIYFCFNLSVKISIDFSSLDNILQFNLGNTYECNKMAHVKDAKTFGVAWFGDSATIKCMHLLNILALCGEDPPILIYIFDCSNHMSKGGKKDAMYIEQMSRKSCQV